MHVRDPKPGDTCAPPPWDGVVSDIDLHGDGTNRNPAESTGFALEWVQMLWEYCGDGTKTCRILWVWNLLFREIYGVCLIKNLT